MQEFSILVGGKAGDGIKQAGNLVAHLFNNLGYWIFIYEDYQSLINGGHNFSIIRVSSQRVLAHRDQIDLAVAFNEETIKKHRREFKKDAILVYDSTLVRNLDNRKQSIGIPMLKIVRENNLPAIVRNSVSLGVLGAICGLDFNLVRKIIKRSIPQKIEENIKVAKIGYLEGKRSKINLDIKKLKGKPKKLLTGNEAIALGAVKGGLEFYVAYPMTPASGILHFLAKNEGVFKVKVIQPENELAVVLMAEGIIFTGKKAMVGTSGGGFALMTEALSLAGQAELPLVIVLSQRMAPATGVPTYTAQGDLQFALNAGHGDFPRIVVAPGDSEEAFYLTQEALSLAWKYQTPAIILSDKHLSESVFSADLKRKPKLEKPILWKGKGDYRRYQISRSGISPLAFPGNPRAVVKATSYEHDEFGITVEEASLVKAMVEKRKRKGETLNREINRRKAVSVYGSEKSKVAILVFGSTKGAAVEVAKKLKLRCLQPLYLKPFPVKEFKKKLEGADKIISVELNSSGQFGRLLREQGVKVDQEILKYDARPFTVDELEKEIRKVL